MSKGTTVTVSNQLLVSIDLSNFKDSSLQGGMLISTTHKESADLIAAINNGNVKLQAREVKVDNVGKIKFVTE
jgi:hypothetical protein